MVEIYVSKRLEWPVVVVVALRDTDCYLWLWWLLKSVVAVAVGPNGEDGRFAPDGKGHFFGVH